MADMTDIIAQAELLTVPAGQSYFISAEACRERKWGRITLLGGLGKKRYNELEALVATFYGATIYLTNMETQEHNGCISLEDTGRSLHEVAFDNCMFSCLACDFPANFALVLSHEDYWDFAGSMTFLRSFCPNLAQVRDDFEHDLEGEFFQPYRENLRAHSRENDMLCAEADQASVTEQD